MIKIYVAIIIVLIVATIAFAFSIKKVEAPKLNGLTGAQISAKLIKIDELNNKRDYFGFGKQAEIVGIYNGRQLEKTYICFGDVCPQNGGYYLKYSDNISQDDCASFGKPIIGIAWGTKYYGCAVR